MCVFLLDASPAVCAGMQANVTIATHQGVSAGVANVEIVANVTNNDKIK
jgi:hypothetical protein